MSPDRGPRHWIFERACWRFERVFSASEEIDMAAERGSAFLLKIGDGAATPAYATVAGLKTTQLSVNGDAVAITNKGSGGGRGLLFGARVRCGSGAASGNFTGSAGEAQGRGGAAEG